MYTYSTSAFYWSTPVSLPGAEYAYNNSATGRSLVAARVSLKQPFLPVQELTLLAMLSARLISSLARQLPRAAPKVYTGGDGFICTLLQYGKSK